MPEGQSPGDAPKAIGDPRAPVFAEQRERLEQLAARARGWCSPRAMPRKIVRHEQRDVHECRGRGWKWSEAEWRCGARTGCRRLQLRLTRRGDRLGRDARERELDAESSGAPTPARRARVAARCRASRPAIAISHSTSAVPTSRSSTAAPLADRARDAAQRAPSHPIRRHPACSAPSSAADAGAPSRSRRRASPRAAARSTRAERAADLEQAHVAMPLREVVLDARARASRADRGAARSRPRPSDWRARTCVASLPRTKGIESASRSPARTHASRTRRVSIASGESGTVPRRNGRSSFENES